MIVIRSVSYGFTNKMVNNCSNMIKAPALAVDDDDNDTAADSAAGSAV